MPVARSQLAPKEKAAKTSGEKTVKNKNEQSIEFKAVSTVFIACIFHPKGVTNRLFLFLGERAVFVESTLA